MPSNPLSGDAVTIVDLAGVFGTYNLTIDRNGKQIQDADENLVLDVNNTGVTLVFSGDTYGWVLLNN